MAGRGRVEVDVMVVVFVYEIGINWRMRRGEVYKKAYRSACTEETGAPT
jgi:hypothetical protein